MYCGSKTLPKGKIYGNEKDCKKQIRLYGKKLISNPVYKNIKEDGVSPFYCGAKKTKRIHGTKTECKKKGQHRLYGMFLINGQSKDMNGKSKKVKIDKIGKLMKVKKEKEDFKQLMKNINAAQYRKRKTFKVLWC